MKNYLLKKSVREELERRGISYGEYVTERNSLRVEARQAKAADRTPGQPAAAARKLEEATRLQHEVVTEQGRTQEQLAWTAPEHRETAETGPATWLQLPAINIGPQDDVVGEQHYQEALKAVAACPALHASLSSLSPLLRPTRRRSQSMGSPSGTSATALTSLAM